MRAALGAEDRVVELDLEVDLEAVEGIELRPLVAILDPHALVHADEALGATLLFDTGRLQQEHERTGAAVHDRNFGRGDLDDRVVDP